MQNSKIWRICVPDTKSAPYTFPTRFIVVAFVDTPFKRQVYADCSALPVPGVRFAKLLVRFPARCAWISCCVATGKTHCCKLSMGRKNVRLRVGHPSSDPWVLKCLPHKIRENVEGFCHRSRTLSGWHVGTLFGAMGSILDSGSQPGSLFFYDHVGCHFGITWIGHNDVGVWLSSWVSLFLVAIFVASIPNGREMLGSGSMSRS